MERIDFLTICIVAVLLTVGIEVLVVVVVLSALRRAADYVERDGEDGMRIEHD